MTGFKHDNHGGISEQSAEMLDTLLSQYVSGSLPRPVKALVDAHMEIRSASRRVVSGLEALAGDEMEAIAPVPLADRDGALNRIFESAAPQMKSLDGLAGEDCPIMPRALRDFIGHTASDIPWRTKLPGFREFRFGEIDGCEVEMLWIRAGRAMPKHTHEGSELTLVLDGGFSDLTGHYLRGDISAADESVDHRPVADTDGPCICFAVTTAPLKLTGSMRQLFSDIFGG